MNAAGLLKGRKVIIHSLNEYGVIVHDPDKRNYREVYREDIKDAWICNCVLPEHSCEACRAKAREVYGGEDEIPWRLYE